MSRGYPASISWSNIAATPASFQLKGGLYAFTAIGTFGPGSLTLQRLAQDGSTYVTCLTALTAAGYATVYLPAGTYRLLVTTVTAIYADLSAVAET